MMHFGIKPVLNLKGSRLEKFHSTHLWGMQEVILDASEVVRLHQHGGKDSPVIKEVLKRNLQEIMGSEYARCRSKSRQNRHVARVISQSFFE
jgi:hypothetical protein